MGALISASMTRGTQAESASERFTLPMMSLIGSAEGVFLSESEDSSGGGEVAHLMEFEAGAMITRRVGISTRHGIGFGARKERDRSIGVGLRFLCRGLATARPLDILRLVFNLHPHA